MHYYYISINSITIAISILLIFVSKCLLIIIVYYVIQTRFQKSWDTVQIVNKKVMQ